MKKTPPVTFYSKIWTKKALNLLKSYAKALIALSLAWIELSRFIYLRSDLTCVPSYDWYSCFLKTKRIFYCLKHWSLFFPLLDNGKPEQTWILLILRDSQQYEFTEYFKLTSSAIISSCSSKANFMISSIFSLVKTWPKNKSIA